MRARCEGRRVADDMAALRAPSTAPWISRGQHRKTLDLRPWSTSGPVRVVDDAFAAMVERAVTASW